MRRQGWRGSRWAIEAVASEERGEGRAGEAVARLGRQRPLKKGARDAAAMGAGAEKAAAGPGSNSWAEEAVAELKRQQPLKKGLKTGLKR